MQKTFRLFLSAFLVLFLFLVSFQVVNYLLDPSSRVLGIRSPDLAQANNLCRSRKGFCQASRNCPKGTAAIYVGRSGCSVTQPYCCIPLPTQTLRPTVTPTPWARSTVTPTPWQLIPTVASPTCQQQGGNCSPIDCQPGYYSLGQRGCSDPSTPYCCVPIPTPRLTDTPNRPTVTPPPSSTCPAIITTARAARVGERVVFDISSPTPLVCTKLENTRGIGNLQFNGVSRDSAGRWHWMWMGTANANGRNTATFRGNTTDSGSGTCNARAIGQWCTASVVYDIYNPGDIIPTTYITPTLAPTAAPGGVPCSLINYYKRIYCSSTALSQPPQTIPCSAIDNLLTNYCPVR